MNIARIVAVVDLFRKGQAVANKEAWKTGQVTATALAGLVLAATAAAKTFGYDPMPGVSEDAVEAVCTVVMGVVNVVGTYITSDSVGILPAKE